VGGRAHQIPLLKGVVERAGGTFLHPADDGTPADNAPV